jgi:hypothetical protein
VDERSIRGVFSGSHAGTKLVLCHRHTAVGECFALQALLWPMVREVLCHRGIIPADSSVMDKPLGSCHDACGEA